MNMTLSSEKGVVTLEEKHLIAVLLFVAIRGECKKIEVYENVSSNPRIPEKLDRLEAMGLLVQKDIPGMRSISIELTPKGRAVADHLNAVDEIIKSN